LLGLWGMALLIGALAGGRDSLQPLSFLAGRANVGQGTAVSAVEELPFERVRNLAELDERISQSTKPVLLDFYADWCVSCIEMERFTFTDPAVDAAMRTLTLLRADVTANSADDKALLQRFKLFGPPGIIFFDAQGREIEDIRVVGYQPAELFGRALAAVQQRSRVSGK